MKVGVYVLLFLLIISIATATDIKLLPEPITTDNTADNGYYEATYADNPTSGETVSFTREGVTIGLQPHSLNWNNALSQLQQINMPQNVQLTTDNNNFYYPDAYGSGITLQYKNTWEGVKEEIIIENLSSLGTIAQYVIDGGSPYLEANFLLTTNAQHIIVEGAEWDKTSQTETSNNITIRDEQGKDLYHLPKPNATDSNGNTVTGTYKLKSTANKLYIGITIPYSFLETATYPVTIDPSFYVDYSPTPALYYINGNQLGTDYATFTSNSDATITLSDGNTNTYVTVSNTPASQDDVVKASFAHTYESGYYYFIRIYQNSAGTTNLTVYPHIDNLTINTTLSATVALNGIGYYSVNVTELMTYMDNHSNLTGASIFRVTSTSTSNNIQLSELYLREEESDAIPPQISSCSVDNPNATCEENITYSCIVTDNVEVDYVTFTVETDGSDTYHLPTKYNNIYTKTFTHSGFDTITYNFTNITATDLFNNEAYYLPNITATYTCIDNCTPNWVAFYQDISPCRTNNTKLQLKTYQDTNTCDKIEGLPSDNGTNIETYCNYCDPDWTNIGTECFNNNTRYVEYIDINNCYSQTNLTEDSPPIDQETWVACNYYTQEFNCTINPTPYDTKKIEYNCELPYNGTEHECVNKVTHQITGQLFQANPQKTERTNSFLLSKEYESRETFTTTYGLLNAYYYNDDILANNDFIITTTCRDGTSTLTNEQLVTPEKKDLKDTANWAIWTGDNAFYLVIALFALMVIAIIAGATLREIRRRK